MDRKVSIVKFVATRNSTNEKEVTQEVIATPWAYMEDVSGTEDVEGKVRYLVSKKFTIRYNAVVNDLKNQLGLLHDGKLFNVINVVEIGRRSHLLIVVKDYE
ncbi:head-tail adaptor protein [Flavobacterium sp. FlaQc-28]|uniref:phage head completion protein n=1 Tax=Flavobacterium sp. FlaQc-28 TaxID=3374178 RepID=UPI003756E181